MPVSFHYGGTTLKCVLLFQTKHARETATTEHVQKRPTAIY